MRQTDLRPGFGHQPDAYRAMGQDGRFEKWASGLLGVVSLILALHLAWSYILPRLESRPRAVAFQSNLTSTTSRDTSPLRIDAANELTQSATQKLRRNEQSPAAMASEDAAQPLAKTATLRAGHSKQFEPNPNTESDGARPEPATDRTSVEVAQSLTVPPPATQTFETIGYVEKPDGTKQAVVSKGDRVFVVHEGEVFDEHYRVLSISSKAVEAADLTVPQSAPVAGPEPTILASRANSPTPRHTAGGSQTTVAAANALGYIERAGRPPEAVVADGDGVSLVASATVSAEGLVAWIPSSSSRDDISPTVSSSRQSSFVALDRSSAPSDMAARADLSSGLPAVASAVPAEEAQEVSALDSEPQGLGLTRGVEPSRGGPSGFIRDVAVRRSSEPPGAARASPSERQILKAFCYVERPESGREAFIALDDKVYSVREGMILADRYRVLGIRPEGVEVVDASVETRPPPIPNQQLAENRNLLNEAPESGNHSPPAELPWSGFVRSVAFLWTNFAMSGDSPGAEPRLFSQNRVEPTLEQSGSSTSRVGVGPHLRLAESNSTTEFGTKNEAASDRQAGYVSVSSVSVRRLAVGATEAARGLMPQEIVQLPLTVNDELLVLPGRSGGVTLAGGIAADRQPAIAGSGRQSSSNGLQPGRPPEGSISSAPAPALTTASLPEISSISGRDLLLSFSIGDNGCYFPK